MKLVTTPASRFTSWAVLRARSGCTIAPGACKGLVLLPLPKRSSNVALPPRWLGLWYMVACQ